MAAVAQQSNIIISGVCFDVRWQRFVEFNNSPPPADLTTQVREVQLEANGQALTSKPIKHKEPDLNPSCYHDLHTYSTICPIMDIYKLLFHCDSCDIFTSLLQWCSGHMLNIITTSVSKEHWGHLFNTDDTWTRSSHCVTEQYNIDKRQKLGKQS